jgi:hypothetical protein
MIEIAVVYLILSFPGTPHSVLALPMANMTVCESERESIEAAYLARSGGLEIFAHCVESGFESSRPSQNSN